MPVKRFCRPKTPKERWYYIFKQWFVLLEIAAALASIAGFFAGHPGWGIGIMLATSLALAFTCVHYVNSTHRLEREVQGLLGCREILHDVVHHARDVLTPEKHSEVGLHDDARKEDARRWIGLARYSLMGLEKCFAKITGANCSASIMLPDPKDPNTLVTSVYSLDAREERKKGPTVLRIGQGLAGRAFATGESLWSDDFTRDKRFMPVREDYESFYQSGISSPFRASASVNKPPYGVVNLDCEHPFAYDEGAKYLVQCFGDLIALTICQIEDCPREQKD